ncbi:MAG: sulfatase [Arenicellales bacterium]
MKRICIQALHVAILMLIASTSASNAAQSKQRLSVLLLTVDNLRPDRMSVYGYDKDTTPYLKKFSQEAVVFDRAFSTSAWTAPGMVSIFTGYYPPVHAQHGRFSYYDDEMASAFKVLAAEGYEILGQAIKGPSHQGFGFQKLLGKGPDRLEAFIEDRKDDFAPFFAWAHIKDVHLPYNPSERNAERFNANTRDTASIEAVKKHRVILRHPELVNIDFEHAGKVEFEDEDVPVVRALYDAEVADVDERLQRNLERMRETGLLDRTIVIISADHGEELFDHGWLGHASTGYDAKLYDELIRIPLIIRVPHLSTHGRFDALVQGVDFMPTIFELLDIDATKVKPAMQGHSFLPVIRRETESIRNYVFTQTTLKGWTTPLDEMRKRIVSVRSDDKKLIWIPDGEKTSVEGYDLVRDPDELNNIYPGEAEQFRDLEEALESWIMDNRSRAASLVMNGAQQRINNIVEVLLRDNDLNKAVSSWTAIQTMEETWGLEPEQFYQIEPYAAQWQNIQQTAAGMIGSAMTCAAKGGKLGTSEPTLPLTVEHWRCN